MLNNDSSANSGEPNPSEGRGELEKKMPAPSTQGEVTQAQMDAFQVRCRKAGLKVTPQRMTVYKTLIESKQHPSADMLYRKVRRIFPNISLDTVNRTLLTLSEIGAASIVEGSGDPKRFDGNLKSHQHFKCIKCKRIIDFHYKPFDSIPVPKTLSKKFTVLKKTVYLEGICDLCSEPRGVHSHKPNVVYGRKERKKGQVERKRW